VKGISTPQSSLLLAKCKKGGRKQFGAEMALLPRAVLP
jgi:hypothetical protein